MSTLTVSNAQVAVHLPTITPTTRWAHGKRLRDRVPRADHDKWQGSSDRADPFDILRAADATRQQDLVPLRYGHMLPSPFTFYRGSVGVMAADLARTPVSGIQVQACGDCHLANFGGFATPERRPILDINDFDETLPASWEWDVKRLVTSFVLAARSNGLSDDDGREAAVACARSYRRKIRNFAAMDVLDVWYARIEDSEVLANATAAVQGRTAKTDRKSDGREQLGAGVPKAGRAGWRGAAHPRYAADYFSCRANAGQRGHGNYPGLAAQISRNAAR
jgi:hypothetical protein